MILLAKGLMFLSGMAGLIYQLTWFRLLGFNLGSDAMAMSVVLAAFFTGLALGGILASALKNSSRHGLIYCWLELLIGISALFVLSILVNLDGIVVNYPFLISNPLLKFLTAFLILLLPAIFIGATFPVLTAAFVTSQITLKSIISQFYSVNTAGALCGVLLGGFVLIPIWGLDGAVYYAASINFVVFILALYLNKLLTGSSEQSVTEDDMEPDIALSTNKPIHGIVLASLSISGFVVICCEIIWVKYFSILTGSSLYSYTMILAATLAGIALGSAISSRNYFKNRNPYYLLFYLFITVALSLFLFRFLMDYFPNIIMTFDQLGNTGEQKQALKYVIIFLMLMPITMFFGLLYPICLQCYAHSVGRVKSHLGKACGLNTLFSVMAAILVGVWLVPRFGTDGVLVFTILVLLIVPLFAITKISQRVHRVGGLLLISFLVIALWFTDGVDFKKHILAVNYQFDGASDDKKSPKFLYLSEGENSIISLTTHDDRFVRLQSNGLKESIIDIQNKSNSLVIETLQAYLPYFLHKNPKSAFVIGYGGGITTQAFVETDINDIKVVEIEPKIVEAVRVLPNSPADALKNDRVKISFGDARSELLVSDESFDVISSQPSHPWQAGSVNIFSQEFFTLLKSRLNENGMVSQWVNLFRMDVTTLKSVLKAFYNVFPHGFTMANQASGDMMLIGSTAPIKFDFNQIQQRMSKSEIKNRLKNIGIYTPASLIWFYKLSRNEVIEATRNSRANSDLNLLSELRLAAIHKTPTGLENPYFFIDQMSHFDITQYLQPEEAKFQLFELGQNYLNWGYPDMTEKISYQLKKVDSIWGNSLNHELLFWKSDYHQASNLYSSSTEWMDISHFRQFQIDIFQNNFQAALTSMRQIKSGTLSRLANAMQLYHQHNWLMLANLVPQTVKEQYWQLMGAAKLNQAGAIEKLASIIPDDFEYLEQLRFLKSYYEKSKFSGLANKFKSRVQSVIDKRLQRYNMLVKMAEHKTETLWLMELQQEINRLILLKRS